MKGSQPRLGKATRRQQGCGAKELALSLDNYLDICHLGSGSEAGEPLPGSRERR